MSSKIISKEKNIVTIEFTISNEDFLKAVDKAYLKVKNDIAIQGFRKGKAPKHIIEKKYGKSVFYDDAMDIAIQQAYPVAVTELNLDVIDSPKIDIEKFEEGQEIVIKADVEVMPEVELCDYNNVEVEKFEINVTDEDVEKELKAIQEKNARIVEITDRAVQNGDTLIIDYAGFVGEEQFEGGTAENQTLEIGSNTFIPGFEEQLIGKNKDEEIEVNVTFPEEYHSEDLQGKAAIFKVTIHEIKAKELPAIDDEFAKDVSEFDTLEELKADTRSTLEQKAKDQVEVTNSNNVITKVVNDSKLDVPNVLVERELTYMVQNYEQQFRQQGFTGKEYDDIITSIVNQYKEDPNAKKQAEFNVKADLVLTALEKVIEVEITEEELNEEINKLVDSYGIEEERKENFKKSIMETNKGQIENSLRRKKVIDKVIAKAKFVDKVEEIEVAVTEENQEEK
jgi:trigger factor